METPRIARASALTLIAGLVSYAVWTIAGWLIEGSLFEDVSLVVKFMAVFITLTLFEKLYSRFEGPAGH